MLTGEVWQIRLCAQRARHPTWNAPPIEGCSPSIHPVLRRCPGRERPGRPGSCSVLKGLKDTAAEHTAWFPPSGGPERQTALRGLLSQRPKAAQGFSGGIVQCAVGPRGLAAAPWLWTVSPGQQGGRGPPEQPSQVTPTSSGTAAHVPSPRSRLRRTGAPAATRAAWEARPGGPAGPQGLRGAPSAPSTQRSCPRPVSPGGLCFEGDRDCEPFIPCSGKVDTSDLPLQPPVNEPPPPVSRTAPTRVQNPHPTGHQPPTPASPKLLSPCWLLWALVPGFPACL